jgi:addiction module toxin, RelE/StbE family
MKKSEVKNVVVKKQSEFRYTVNVTNTFKKEFVDCWKQGLDIQLLIDAVEILATKGKLPSAYRPHKLDGNFKGLWECHIKGDWLLVWQQNDTQLTLLLSNTGSHSYLFCM